MTRPVLANNAFGLLASDIGPEATAIPLSIGDGDRFPNITVGEQHFYVTLIDSRNNVEIVKVTERSGDILTVIRGQDNTTPKQFKATNRVELRFVSALFSEIFTAVGIGFDDSTIRPPVTWDDDPVDWGTSPVLWTIPFFDVSIGNAEGAINALYLYSDAIDQELANTTQIVLGISDTFSAFVNNSFVPLTQLVAESAQDIDFIDSNLTSFQTTYNTFITDSFNPLVSFVTDLDTDFTNSILTSETVAGGSTVRNRAVIASTFSISDASNSATIASQGEDDNNLFGALTSLSVVIGSSKSSTVGDATLSLIAASSDSVTSSPRSAIIASNESIISPSASEDIQLNFIAASQFSIARGVLSAVIASQGEDVDNLYGALGSLSAVIASTKSFVAADASLSTITGSSESLISDSDRAGIIASSEAIITESPLAIVAASSKGSVFDSPRSGVMLSDNCQVFEGSNAAVLCSSNTLSGGTLGNFTITLGSGDPGTNGEPLSSNRKVVISGEFGDILLAGGINTGETFGDFVEYLPNATGEELLPGTLLALDNDAVRPAELADRIVGVVSHTGVLNAGDTPFCWQGRYLSDEWGRPIYDDVPDSEWNPSDGQTEADRPTKKVRRQSPDWNPDLPQIPRSQRPNEWTPVGLLGQVLVRTGESVAPGSSLYAVGGVGFSSESPTGVRVMRITKPYDGNYGIAKCLLCIRV